jgi:hypothetical protein
MGAAFAEVVVFVEDALLVLGKMGPGLPELLVREDFEPTSRVPLMGRKALYSLGCGHSGLRISEETSDSFYPS